MSGAMARCEHICTNTTSTTFVVGVVVGVVPMDELDALDAELALGATLSLGAGGPDSDLGPNGVGIGQQIVGPDEGRFDVRAKDGRLEGAGGCRRRPEPVARRGAGRVVGQMQYQWVFDTGRKAFNDQRGVQWHWRCEDVDEEYEAARQDLIATGHVYAPVVVVRGEPAPAPAPARAPSPPAASVVTATAAEVLSPIQRRDARRKRGGGAGGAQEGGCARTEEDAG